ncbi:CRTAC1 family protein [Planctomycetota bacterium]
MRQAMMKTCLLSILLWLLLGMVRPAQAQEEAGPYFTNVADAMGFLDEPAKGVCFVDANGDGYWDVFMEKQHLYLNREGKTFNRVECGIKFPVVKLVPMSKDGKPEPDKAKEKQFVPQYVYFADLDNDGDFDAICGVKSNWEHFDGRSWLTVPACDHGLRTTIFLNDGKGGFSKAKSQGISSPDNFGPSSAMAILDFDNDGWLDIYEGREYRKYGVLYGCGVDRLWKGNSKMAFVDVTKKTGLLTVPNPGQRNSSRPSYGVSHGDMNNDGCQDLLEMAYGRQWNLHWQNNGRGVFTEIGIKSNFAGDSITHGRYPKRVNRSPEQPYRSNGNTFDCAIADYDNDGDLDCFLGGIQHAWAGEASDPPSLLINQGKEGEWKFKRVPVTECLPKRDFRDSRNFNYGDLHVAWLDFDNDMRQDLLIASGDYPDGQFLRLYRQKEDHSFEEVTKAAGFNWEGCGGLSVGDYDRDGDVDILVGRSFMRLNQAHRDKYMNGIKVNKAGLFRNNAADANGNHWVNIRLAGKGKGSSNRFGIGARVTITTGETTQLREIRCGSGLGGHQDPPEACFGLGKVETIDRMVITWPNKKHKKQVFSDVPVDCFITVKEGKKKLTIENR